MKLTLPYCVRRQFCAAVTYGTTESLPVSWKTLAGPVGISKVTPAAATVPVSLLRRKVHFGPSQSSENPLCEGTGDASPGLIQTPPSLLMTNDQFSVRATRACRPKNSALPPRKSELAFGIVW